MKQKQNQKQQKGAKNASKSIHEEVVVLQRPPRAPRAPRQKTYSLVDQFVDRLLFPGIAPVAPMPRFGGGTRMHSTLDRTIALQAVPSVAGNCGCVVADTSIDQTRGSLYFNVGAAGAGVAPTTLFTTHTSNVAPNTFGVASAAIFDATCTACSLTVRYLGNALNAQGEILIGTVPSFVGGATTMDLTTYNALKAYPGIRTFSVAEIIQEGGVSVSMTKGSTDSYALNLTSVVDANVPVVAFSGMPATGNLAFDLIRSFDYRPNNAQSTVYSQNQPSEDSRQMIDAFEDATQVVSNSVDTTWFESSARYVKALAAGFNGAGLSLIGGLGTAAATHLFARHTSRAQFNRQFLPVLAEEHNL